MGPINIPWLLIIVLCVWIEWKPRFVGAALPDNLKADRPCDHPKAIDLPNTGKCLVPMTSAYNWTRAQSNCELAHGSLYKTPSDLQLPSNQGLLNCLTSMTEPTLTDLWMNSISQWHPQFSWVNNTVLNRVVYCTRRQPVRGDEETRQSITLSIDYCVLSCHTSAASYVVLYNSRGRSNCYCVHQLADVYKEPCDTDTFSYRNLTHFFIARTPQQPLIRLAQGNVSNGEIMCATVNTLTVDSRQMDSQPCANRYPFICNLGDAVSCPRPACDGSNCVFAWRGSCLRRIDERLSWSEARNYCNRSGGDLWHMGDIGEMKEMNSNLQQKLSYWIGASNFHLQLNANSASLESFGSNFQRVRCGHLENVHETNRWQWSSTTCDKPKAYLCQFEKDSFSQDEEGLDAVCPWPTPVTSKPLIIPPPFIRPASDDDGDAFPIAALISGLIAGLVLLTCLAVTCAYCCRRRWWFRVYSKKDQVAFVPYVTEPPDPVFVTNGHELESMSHAGRIRSASSFSENGSQHGMVKALPYHNAGYSHSHTAMSDSYLNSNGGMHYSSKSLDRNHLAVRDRRGMDSSSSYDERALASYGTLPIKPRDYMILEGQMTIQEEQALRGSIRGKPEVTLVTDHADMNFTVNHASPHGHPGSDRSSLERTLEEIHMPVSDGHMTLTVPDRVVEARSMSMTSSMTRY